MRASACSMREEVCYLCLLLIYAMSPESFIPTLELYSSGGALHRRALRRNLRAARCFFSGLGSAQFLADYPAKIRECVGRSDSDASGEDLPYPVMRS
jgi:hypothetical protein